MFLLTHRYLKLAVSLFLFVGFSLATAHFVRAGEPEWVSTNGPDITTVYEVGVASQLGSDDILFIAVDQKVFTSTNGGSSWEVVNDLPHDYQVRALAIEDVGGTIGNIYAGRSAASGAKSLYRSTDVGTSWITPTATAPAYILDLTTVNPMGLPGRVYAASAHDPEGGIYQSTDEGVTWTGILTGWPMRVVGAAYDTVGGSTVIYAGGATGGLWMSADGGATWAAVPSVTGVVLSLLIDQTNGVFAGTSTGLFNGNLGDTNFNAVPDLAGRQIRSLAAGSSGTIYAGDYQNGLVYKSTNGGSSWTAVGTPVAGTPVLSLAVADSGLYAGLQNKGIYRSTDEGETWTAVNNGLNAGPAPITSLAASPNPGGPSTILAGTISKGVFLYNNGQWQAWSNGLPIPDEVSRLEVVPQGPQAVWYAGTTEGVFATVYGFSTEWAPILPNFSVSAMTIDRRNLPNSASLYVGSGTGQGVRKSDNGGQNWTPINTGLPSDYEILDLVIDSDGNLYVSGSSSSDGHSVYKSTDQGASWQKMTDGFPAPVPQILDLAVAPDPWGNDVIYAVSANNIYASADKSTWGDNSQNPPSDMFMLFPHPGQPSRFYLTTLNGVYQTTNGMISWEPYNDGLPTPLPDLTTTVMLIDSGDLYLGTYSQGMYQFDFPKTYLPLILKN